MLTMTYCGMRFNVVYRTFPWYTEGLKAVFMICFQSEPYGDDIKAH